MTDTMDRHRQEVDPILEQLGRNVLSARKERRWPRRVLADASGVSQRYLAQLENGQGNISISLLQRVAVALDLKMEELLREPGSEEDTRLVDLFHRADAATQQAVMQRLEMAASVPDRAQRICLIGLRGAGKSTLGRAVGDLLGVPFIELNREIEAQGGMPVSEIMALYGAEGFRQLEAEAVRRVATRHKKLILAVAGGIVSDAETYTVLLERYHTIWVRTSPEEHMSRVRAQGDMRPMEGRSAAMDQLRALLRMREAAYARADAQLDTSGKSTEHSKRELVELISSRGFLGSDRV